MSWMEEVWDALRRHGTHRESPPNWRPDAEVYDYTTLPPTKKPWVQWADERVKALTQENLDLVRELDEARAHNEIMALLPPEPPMFKATLKGTVGLLAAFGAGYALGQGSNLIHAAHKVATKVRRFGW